MRLLPLLLLALQLVTKHKDSLAQLQLKLEREDMVRISPTITASIQTPINSSTSSTPDIKSLFFLWAQGELLSKIAESCNLEIANQVLYACNYGIVLEGPVI
ncbi:hypothetical protein Moror_13421, partial [Moniliophthora roreri MCA 2997]